MALHSTLAVILGHRRNLDPLFHLLGGAAGAFAVLQVIHRFRALVPGGAVRNPTVSAVAVVSAIAVVWEFMEFTSDRFLGTHVQIDAGDTGTDVILGMAGAMLMAGLAAIARRRARKP